MLDFWPFNRKRKVAERRAAQERETARLDAEWKAMRERNRRSGLTAQGAVKSERRASASRNFETPYGGSESSPAPVDNTLFYATQLSQSYGDTSSGCSSSSSYSSSDSGSSSSDSGSSSSDSGGSCGGGD